MAITSGFFDAIQQEDGSYDRTYSADQLSTYFEGIVSDGIYADVGDGMQVVASSGMQVQVKPGRAIIDAKWIRNTAAYGITLNPSHVTLNRYTAIVIRLDQTARTISVEMKDGENATEPKKPALTDTQTVKELCLAYIYVGRSVSAITQADIEDTRADGNVCGWVTGLIEQVDTSQLFLQFQDAYEQQLETMKNWQEQKKSDFEAWFAALTDQLQVNAYIKQYYRAETLTGYTDALSVGISEYDAEKDILSVDLNGLLLAEGTDYYINAENNRIGFNNTLDPGNTVGIRVLKSKIGQA